MERAQNLRAEPVQITLEPASSPSFLLIKMLKFEFEPTTSLLEILARRAWGLFTVSQKLDPGLRARAQARSTSSPGINEPSLSTHMLT